MIDGPQEAADPPDSEMLEMLLPPSHWRPHGAAEEPAVDYDNARLEEELRVYPLQRAKKPPRTRSAAQGARDRVPFVSEPLESFPKLIVFFFRPWVPTWKKALGQRPLMLLRYIASLRMEGSTASLYRLAHWSSVRPGRSFATSYQRFPYLLTAAKRVASSLVVHRP